MMMFRYIQIQYRRMKGAALSEVQPKVPDEDEEKDLSGSDFWHERETPSDKSIRSVPKTQKIHRTKKHCDQNQNQNIYKEEPSLTTRSSHKPAPVNLPPSCKVIGTNKMCLPKLQQSSKVLKEGKLQQKTDGFFFKWTERYVVLTPEKLMWYDDPKKSKVLGCTNLKLLKAELNITQKGHIHLDFKGECEDLIFRAQTANQLIKWQQTLMTVVNFQETNQKLMLKTMNKEKYLHKDVLTEKQFLKTADTGDILLFYTQHFGAKMQRLLTNSDFDHVAMVIRMKNKEPMVFQANQLHGVAIYDWPQYINYFDLYGKVAIRRLQYSQKQEIQPKLVQFVRHNLGKKYQLSASKLFTLESDFNWETVKAERGYFCSELIGKALKSVGLLDEKKSSGRYWPVDFAEVSELKMKQGASLGQEETIVLSKHTKNRLK